MAFLTLSPEKCVRALSVNSICTHCTEVCPTSAIVISAKLPSINHSLCVGCAGCVAVCPTEALVQDDFNPTDFFFSFASGDETMMSCQKNVPCLSAISPEHAVGLAQLKSGLVWDIGHCSECEIAHKALPLIESCAENANYLLEAMDSAHRIRLEKVAYQDEGQQEEKGRRDFFKTFHLRHLSAAKANFEKEIQSATDEFVEYQLSSTHTAGLKTKKITDRRKIFYTVLKRMEKPSVYHVVDASKITFTSQKLMDEAKCTGCEMCYRVCPTGALVSDMRNSKIDFDPFLCVKCHLCHDVCEPDAITLSPSYNLKEWFEPSKRNLITYLVRRCDECDGLFSSLGGEKICRRCRLEEEEARELWGI